MKGTKRLTAWILAVMMMISTLPLGIFAEETAAPQSDWEAGLYWCKYRGVSNEMPVYHSEEASTSMRYQTGNSVNAVFLFWNGVQFVLLKDHELSFPEGVEHEAMEGGFGGVSLSFPEELTGSITYTNAEGTYAVAVEVNEPEMPVVGFYDACDRTEDAWIGNGNDHVLTGTADEQKTVYALWDADFIQTVASVTLSFEDVDHDGEVFKELTPEAAAPILAQYGITVTPMLGKGYIQVDTGFSHARNLELFLTDEDGDVYDAHLSIDEKEISDGGEEEQPVIREVDLYWSKFHGMDNGAPDYSTDYAADCMWDEVGQDINAVFLFWDGSAFSEVPFEELSFPKGLTYSQNEAYANAVYMVFDKALVGDITYTRDGQTYAFPLEVEDLTGEEEEAVLKWCWVNRENGVYLPQVDYLSEEIWMELGDEMLLAVYLQQGGKKTLIPYEDLIFKGEGFSIEVNEEDERFFQICAESSGTGSIRYKTSGMTYELPVEVALPHLGFYSRPERCDDAFVGNKLLYTGENDVYYVILRDEQVIQSVEIVWQDQPVTEDQIRVVIADDGTYAALHLGENLQQDKIHNITVQYSNGFSSRSFWFRNGKAGLRSCLVDRSNGEYTLRLDSLNDEFLKVYDRGNGSSCAFCFCEGDQVTPVELQDLEFPAFLKPEIRFEDQDLDWYLIVKYNSLGSGDIIYRKDGVEYALPARVDLPDLGLYTEARRSEETYTYGTLEYTGENTVYYLFAPEGWSVTNVRNIPAFMMVAYPADVDYAVVTLSEGFESNERYELSVSYQNADGGSNYNFTTDFVVRDTRAGLRWCGVNGNNDNLTADIGNLRTELNREITPYGRTWIAFYFEENGQVELLDGEDLNFPALVDVERINENQPQYLAVKFLKFGSSEVTYERNGVIYRMPMEVTLPGLGFYTEPVRSKATYAEPMVFDGKDEAGNTVTQETFYLMLKDDYEVIDLKFTDGQPDYVSYEIVDGYVEVTIDAGADGEWQNIEVTYGDSENPNWTNTWWSGFRVKDESPGLRWCWVERHNSQYEPQMENLERKLWLNLGDDARIAVYLQDGERKTLIPYEDLQFEGHCFHDEALSDHDDYFYLYGDTCGPGKIVYEADGITYSLPVEVELPQLGFYTSPERSEETFAGTELAYTGENNVYYAMLDTDHPIQRAEILLDDQPVDEDEIKIEISADGTYATVTLGEDIRDGESYKIYLHYDNGSCSGRNFLVQDTRPGLKWVYLRWDDNDNLYEDMEDVRSDLDYSVDDSIRAAFYFVDGDKWERLSPDELQFPGFLKLERMEEHEDYVRVRFKTFGSGNVTYTRDGVTYSMPASVKLPDVCFYSQPVRSEETYLGQELPFDGKDEDGNAVTEETFYLMMMDGWKVTEVEFEDGQPGFISYKIVDGYAAVTVSDGFDEENYDIRVYAAREDDADRTGDWGMDFAVLDNRPGIKWCSVDDPDGILTPETDNLRDNMNFSANLGSSTDASFWFVDGEEMTQLMLEDLEWDDLVDFELLEEEDQEKDGFFRVQFKEFGSGAIRYTKNGITYQLPVTVKLPDVCFYSQPVRSEETYLGRELPFDGKDEDGNAITEETFYLMMRDDWEITEVEFEDGQPDFISYKIVDGYAAVTVSGGFDDEWCEVLVYCQDLEDPDNINDWWANFKIEDNRPGIKWVYLRWDDNDNLYEDMEDIRSDLDSSMNSSVRAAFYFVEGDKRERIPTNDLVFPDFLEIEPIDGYEDEDYVWVNFEQFGSGEVTYERDGVTYSMPASVGLPSIGYYSQPVHSEETYVGNTLSFDGKDNQGNATDTETFYLMMNGNWNIAELEFTEDQPDFVSYEIVDGYAVVTISKDFQESWWEVKAHCQRKDNPNNTDWWWADFEISDNRPGLKWKWVDFGGDGQFPFVPEDEEFQSVISHRVDSGVTVAVYYVDGDTEVLIPKKKLILPDFVEIEPNTDAEGGDYFFWLSFLAVGEGEITCADYPGCGLPVVSELPYIALYSQPEAEEDYLLDNKNLSLDFSEEAEDGRRYATVYIVPTEEWYLTDLQMGGNGNDTPMDFLEYTVNEAENYIELKVYDEYVPDWYSLQVFYEREDGREDDRRVEFRMADKPILQWMQVMEADGTYVITGGSRNLFMKPGESQMVAVCYTCGNEMVVLDDDDLTFPDFLSVERLDQDDPTLFKVTAAGQGQGFITSKTYPDLRLKVVSEQELLGYYTQPEMNGDYLNNRLNSEEGKDIVRWLIWDPQQLTDVTDVTLTLKNEEHTVLVDDVSASSADLSKWGINVTLDLEAGHMKLVAKDGDWYNLTAKVWQGEEYARITVNLNSDPNDWGHIWDDGYPTITYNGVPYSFFIAFGYDDTERIQPISNFGSSGGGTHDSDLVIGAMGWYETDKEEEAPEEVLKAIKNVQFRIGKFQNFDASGDQLESNFKLLKEVQCNLHGKPLYGNKVASYDGMYVYADFIVTFTVELPGMEPQTFTMNAIGHRLPDRSIDLDMTSLTTAEELNAVLSSDEAVMAWVKTNQPKAHAQFKALEAAEGRAMYASFSAVLAPVVFEDVIVLCTENTQMNLSGSVDDNGNRTTMPGLWLKNNDCGWVESIDFVADANKTMTWGKGKAFTCGVLAGGEDDRHGDAYGVDDCTFTGFDYGIRCTEYSFTAPGRGCTFVDCEYGYYVDCGKKENGNANSDVTYCSFINCGTAIRIKALPTYVSPYDLVISNNDFINNKWDIDLSVRGRFFFNGNYYGKTEDGSVPEVRDDCIYRTAQVHGRGYATIIVNPRWQLPCTFAGPNKLVMDTHKGLNNYMINEDADQNPIDSKTLAYDLGLYTEEELLRIIMTDDSENTLGTWTFSGTKDSEAVSLLGAAGTNDTFNAELAFGEDADGNTTVTVQDSSILSGGNVKLTVPCSFLDAKVTVNGREVDASVANGQVTFTVIGGGTYVIHAVELEESEDAFITGGAAESTPDAGDTPVEQPKAEVNMGWYNYGHGETDGDTGEEAAPKFATATTETIAVAKEIDPDADLDQVVGDEKVEEKTETTQIVTVQAIYQAPAAAEPGDTVSDVVVLLVLYDKTGQMIAMHQQVAQQSDGTRVITVQCDAALLTSNAVTVKAFVISASGDMRPLAPVPFSQTLTFDAK